MAKKSDFESKSILRRLAFFFPAFYLGYFVISIVVLAAAQLALTVDKVFFLPFDWLSFNPAGQTEELVTFIALLVAFLVLGPIVLFLIVANTKQCWDFTATLCLTHFVLTCLATLDFPVNWIWWVVFLPSGWLMSTGGELSCYYLRDMREIHVDHT